MFLFCLLNGLHLLVVLLLDLWATKIREFRLLYSLIHIRGGRRNGFTSFTKKFA